MKKKEAKINTTRNKVVIYQAKNGAIELRGDVTHNTIWATQAQIAEAFSVNVRTVNEHIQNIYKTKELEKKATIRNFRIVQREGKREVVRDTMHYNLDTILSVGYRVNSKTATQFRQWATKTLREHITKGYTINRKRIAQNYDAFMRTVADVQSLLPAHVTLDPNAVLELVKEFAGTWVSLQAYDTDTLTTKGSTRKSVRLSGEMLAGALQTLKHDLMAQGEATNLFAQERAKGSVEGIIGNVMQSFGGKDVYPTVEEKAAHLLYFMVKNHPFTDGNKRSGAFAFVWYLRKARVLNTAHITPPALTALTLLIAESNPTDKDKMIGLVVTLLTRKK